MPSHPLEFNKTETYPSWLLISCKLRFIFERTTAVIRWASNSVLIFSFAMRSDVKRSNNVIVLLFEIRNSWGQKRVARADWFPPFHLGFWLAERYKARERKLATGSCCVQSTVVSVPIWNSILMSIMLIMCLRISVFSVISYRREGLE